MNQPEAMHSRKSDSREYPAYLIALFSSLLIAFLLYKIRRIVWSVPLVYTGDGLFYSMLIKGIVENGWHLHNPALGAPWGMDLYDFPIPDTFHLLIFKIAGLFTSNHGLIMNVFYFSTFPATALVSLGVLRHFKVSRSSALLASLLYAFIPFHLNRSENHLMYTAYYAVPLIVMALLWICDANGVRLSFRDRKFVISLLICVLVASTGGVYYAFFASYLFFAVGLTKAIFDRQWRRLALPGVMIAVIFSTLLVNLSPSIIYRMKNGKTSTVERSIAEAEIYGLKVAQLLLPITGHRFRPLRELKDRYYTNPMVNENDDSSLGLIGSAGFLALLGWLLSKGLTGVSAAISDRDRLMSHLSVLNISAVLLGTIGGFSSLFALMVSPQIRAYNRISVFISFFCFFAFALLLDNPVRSFFEKRRRAVVFPAIVALLIILGILDQTTRRYVPDYVYTQSEYRNDANFIGKVEAALPKGSMIFQLPVKGFPETDPIERLVDYDLFRGYLHSQSLRWSYGAMKDRKGDVWLSSMAAKPFSELIENAAHAGFNGIYVDRFGYADQGSGVESGLTALTGASPMTSENNRFSFFDLKDYRQKLNERYSAEELAAKREEALYPLLVIWGEGFSGQEGSPEDNWRWGRWSARITLENSSQRTRRVTFEAAFASKNEAPLKIESPLFTGEIITKLEAVPFSKAIDVPPGQHVINFTSSAQRIYAANDPRILVFRINNLKLTPILNRL